MEHPRPLSPFRSFLPSALILFLVGWGGLALLFTFSLPDVWPRWTFFVLWDLALTGTALPAAWFLNLRFPGTPSAGDAVVVRQAIWAGVYGATLAWLQLGGVASLWIIVGLAAGLAAIETLIRMRERSLWQPPATEEDEPETDDQPA
ncbi:MAG: hypothetical protein FD146_2150 [Anaerolineaceae bacterium]|nr:MAG: hypothetical protein FD146_2150 [Anaerolineaceae bacterium]